MNGTIRAVPEATDAPLDRGSPEAERPASRGIQLARRLADRAPDLAEALTTIATRSSAEDEVARGVAALAGSDWELARNRPRPVDRLAAFMPSNNVLYSYVLFGVIPSLFVDEVTLRPSSRVREVTIRLHEIMGGFLDGVDAGEVIVSNASQRVFTRSCRDADFVVFTGQFENSIEIAEKLGPEATLLRFGSGPNPVVVGEQAVLHEVVDDVVAARMYNVGQDCLCPDIIFVSSALQEQFLEALAERLSRLTDGDRRDPATQVAPLVYRDAAEGAAAFLEQQRERILFGGLTDVSLGIVEPTIVAAPGVDFHPPELFSPIFCVAPYDRPEQLEAWFETPEELSRGMYASIYGEPALDRQVLGTTIVCPGRTTFDTECGNQPFGGFGERSSSRVKKGRSAAGPLLVSREASWT